MNFFLYKYFWIIAIFSSIVQNPFIAIATHIKSVPLLEPYSKLSIFLQGILSIKFLGNKLQYFYLPIDLW